MNMLQKIKLSGSNIKIDGRWNFDDDKTETKKVPDIKIQGHTMSKQDLYEKQYGKKANTAPVPSEDAEIDFSKLNSLDEAQ